MPSIHRIQWIDKEIRSLNYPNSTTISREFEISARQALRDIEYLKCSLNAPVEYCYKNRGYYYSDTVFRIPSEMISLSETKLLGRIIHSYEGEESEEVLRLRSLFSQEHRSRDGHFLEVLRVAVHKSIKVELEREGQRVPGRVLPLELEFREWEYQLTFMKDYSEEVLTFSVGEITGVKLSKETFNPKNPRVSGRSEKKLYKAEVLFHGDADLSSYAYETQIRGECAVLSFHSSQEILAWLMKNDAPFTIVKPRWLRERLTEKLRKILDFNTP